MRFRKYVKRKVSYDTLSNILGDDTWDDLEVVVPPRHNKAGCVVRYNGMEYTVMAGRSAWRRDAKHQDRRKTRYTPIADDAYAPVHRERMD